MTLLQMQGVSKRFRRGLQDVVALDAVDFEVGAGELVSLVGRSGSGKSTLLHLAGGLDRPDQGRVTFDGRDLGSLSIGERARMRRRTIGFVFQFFHLIPTLNVRENVELPLLLDGVRRNGRAGELLERVGLSDRMDHLPTQLSGGELQRAAIARALVAEPALILADEPTGNLDSANGETVLALLLEQVRASGAALLMVTHDPGATRGTRCHTLHDGRIAETVPADPVSGER